MSESGDFDPGPWRGHDFASAYDHYDRHASASRSTPAYDASAGRSYSGSASRSRSRSRSKNVLEASISTKCTNPLVIWTDVTGSMKDWPTVIFSKLPYLELEGKEYLGDDLEIAFGAIGDCFAPDAYPVQMRPFTSGTDLKKRMEELEIEGGGGGTRQENYELGALYSLHNIKMSKAIRPVLIMIGDEQPYDMVDVDTAKKHAGVTLEKRMSTAEIFAALKRKFAVYVVRKPYNSDGSNTMSSDDREIRKAWVDLVGEDHVSDLPEAGRVVDVIFGILAKETGRVDYFREELEGRQTKAQVATVYKSLASIHKLPGPSKRSGRAGASILKLEDGREGKVSKKLK